MRLSGNRNLIKKMLLFMLLLLVSSTSAFPFAAEQVTDRDQQVLSFDLKEKLFELSPATIAAPPFKLNATGQGNSHRDDHQLLLDSIRINPEYLKIARQISPGLDVPKMIYPFHVFF